MRQAARAAGGRQVAVAGGRPVPGQLQQVGPDGVEPVPGHDPPVGFEAREQVQPGPRAAGHGHRDGVVQGRHRIVGDLQQQ